MRGKIRIGAILGIVAALLLLLLLVGCASTPFTSEGIAKALEAARPVLMELATSPASAKASAGRPITVVIVMPNIARSIWPFSEVRVGTTEEYVIVVPAVRRVKAEGREP